MTVRSIAAVLLLGLLIATRVSAEETLVAVASNFTATAKDIATAFEIETGHRAKLSFGSTGKLYAQIAHGAPFDLFLAADSERPALAEQQGFAVAGSAFTYARGKLVLYSLDPDLVVNEGEALNNPESFARIAIANPATAPYGEAAVAVMQHMGVYAKVESKIVKGENIAQVYQYVITQNVQLGFVALSQVIAESRGSQWIIPEELYAPIKQDAVLLTRGSGNPAAQAFMEFLKGAEARRIIESYGYGLD